MGIKGFLWATLGFIFEVLYWLNCAVVNTVLYPVGFTKHRKIISDALGGGVVFLLKHVLAIDHKIIGAENLPKNTPFVVACKHQSTWETMVLLHIIPNCAFVLKKELLKIPLFNLNIKRLGMIAIDRGEGVASIKALIKQAKQRVSEGRNVVIFPQGTRVPVNSNTKEYPYKSGVAACYASLNVPIIPAALNSGIFWPKGMFKTKKSGTITVQFLPQMPPNLDKKTFLLELEDKIESTTKKLVANIT